MVSAPILSTVGLSVGTNRRTVAGWRTSQAFGIVANTGAWEGRAVAETLDRPGGRSTIVDPALGRAPSRANANTPTAATATAAATARIAPMTPDRRAFALGASGGEYTRWKGSGRRGRPNPSPQSPAARPGRSLVEKVTGGRSRIPGPVSVDVGDAAGL